MARGDASLRASEAKLFRSSLKFAVLQREKAADAKRGEGLPGVIPRLMSYAGEIISYLTTLRDAHGNLTRHHVPLAPAEPQTGQTVVEVVFIDRNKFLPEPEVEDFETIGATIMPTVAMQYVDPPTDLVTLVDPPKDVEAVKAETMPAARSDGLVPSPELDALIGCHNREMRQRKKGLPKPVPIKRPQTRQQWLAARQAELVEEGASAYEAMIHANAELATGATPWKA